MEKPPIRSNAILNLPAGAPPCHTLARFLMEESASLGHRGDLGGWHVLLPTNRACLALTDQLAHLEPTILLPEISPVSKLNERLLQLHTPGPAPHEAIDTLHRQILLARLLEPALAITGPAYPGRLVTLANSLALWIDEIHITDRNLADIDRALATLVPESYAEHWEQTTRFLSIVTALWPSILKEQGKLDPVEHRNRIIEAQIELWRQTPPAAPVILAGSTGSVRATARLIEAIAGQPAGRIILPGLDRTPGEEEWHEIENDPFHPQHMLARLLLRLKLKRAGIQDVPGSSTQTQARMKLLSIAMRPRLASSRWRETLSAAPPPKETLAGLTRIDCAHIEEEAGLIALSMREALHLHAKQPARHGYAAMLVTPDRHLARRVAGTLKRWNIEIEDSAGRPLAATPGGSFLRLVARWLFHDDDFGNLLALLHHPFAACGLSHPTCRHAARRLEHEARRANPQPREIHQLLNLPGSKKDRNLLALLTFLQNIRARLQKDQRAHRDFADEITTLWEITRQLAALPDGTDPLTKNEDGQALLDWLNRLQTALGGENTRPGWSPFTGTGTGTGKPAWHIDLLDALLETETVRPHRGQNPLLIILGPLEARMQNADLVILGSLNEESWPSPPEPSPWLSHEMRARLGLAPLTRHIGQSAHDFIQNCAAERTLLTRSRIINGAPAIPSRWLARIDVTLDIADLEYPTDPGNLLSLQRWLDLSLDPSGTCELPPRPATRPAPRPPANYRLNRYSVTTIERLIHNPYQIYAQKILGLQPLPPYTGPTLAILRGSITHMAIKRLHDESPNAYGHEARDLLNRIFAELMEQAGLSATNTAFWKQRIHNLASWYLEESGKLQEKISASYFEIPGKTVLDPEGTPITLQARADRIDTLRDGSIRIIDFKTGSIPAKKDVAAGLRPQLPLEGVILQMGGFPEIAANKKLELEYWLLHGTRTLHGRRIQPLGVDPAEISRAIEWTEKGIVKLAKAYLHPDQPFLAMREGSYPDDPYQLLARSAEWREE